MTIAKNNQQVLRRTLQIKAQFLAEVEFGMPSKKCANYGICRVISFRNKSVKKLCVACEEKRCSGIITIFNQKHIEMDFLKKNISTTIYEKHFANKIFKVQEKFFYQDQHCKFEISKGNYRIVENRRLVRVIFSPTRKTLF